MEVGLKFNKPFVYLDDLCPAVDWEDLNNDIVRGLSKAQWIKTAVSAGVHPDWAETEMATYYRNPEKYLTPAQVKIFNSLQTIDQKIKFLSMTTPTVHPFWLCFLRANKIIEPTGHANKADPDTCYDTPNIVYFPKLMSLVRKLPMKRIARVLIFMTEANNETVPHFDAYSSVEREAMPNAQFIWFQPQKQAKRFFVLDDQKNRYYPDPSKQFVWFNELDYHGTEPCPVFSYSVRVEGEFDDRVGASGY